MKIHIPGIPEGGRSIPLSEKEPWVRRFMTESLSDMCNSETRLRGRLRLMRTNDNVSLYGVFTLPLQLNCDRCARSFVREMEINLTRHLAPFFSDPEARDEDEEVELTEEDLEFSFYHGEEIDLAGILVEEILLAVPMGHYCREDCKGLCPHCGLDLNEASCACAESLEASPFTVLRNLKL